MAVIEGGVSGALVGVGAESQSALHAQIKPIAYGVLGHYRVNHRCVLAAAQAANSRIFEVRNTHASNLIIPTRLVVRLIQTAAGTAQENSLDVYKCTAFTAVDTTNTVTPTVSNKRTSMAAAPGGAAVRGVTVAGAAAGMTGGTLTKDGGSVGQCPLLIAAAASSVVYTYDLLDDVNGTHPFTLIQNEGLIIENRVLNVTSYGFSAYIDFSWAEVTAF